MTVPALRYGHRFTVQKRSQRLHRRSQKLRILRFKDRINDLIRFILHYPVLPAVKSLLKWSGLDGGYCVKPRRELSAVETADLATRLPGTEFAERSRSAA